MKLRIKLPSTVNIIEIDRKEPSDVTLSELKSIVAVTFGLEDKEFSLSLNKAEALPCDDQHLSSAGIVSGDLLHIIGLESSQDTHEVQVYREENVLSETGTQVNRFLFEPLVVRESTDTQVPVLLEQLYLSSLCSSTTDALWIVLNTLMLEGGFIPQEVSDVSQMPPNWKHQGYYKGIYKLTMQNGIVACCSVVGVSVGSSIVVHGYGNDDSTFKTEQLQLKPSDYVNSLSNNVPQVYVSLDRLSRLFKDTVCLPLRIELVSGAGMLGEQGFTALPYEVKVRIVSTLDARTLCQLAQTCSDIATLVKDKVIWRRLYFKDFGKPENSALSRDWYELYKKHFVARKEEERRRKELCDTENYHHHFGFHDNFRHHIPGHVMFPPRMVGGDYDLNPEFASGGTLNPLQQMQGNPVRLAYRHPMQGLPRGGMQRPQFLSNTAESRNSNIARSPFSHNDFGESGSSMFHISFM